MKVEFHVVLSDLRSMRIVAEHEAAAREQIEQIEEFKLQGVHAISISEVRVIIDWEHQRIFDREEAAAFVRKTPSFIDQMMGKGWLPKAKNGRPIFTRRMLMELMAKILGKSVDELQEAA